MKTPSGKTLLKNGVRILTKKIPQVRSISLGVWVNVGSRDEREDESGLSHFIEHMLFKGTTIRSAFQLAKEFDGIGGQFNAFTSMEVTCFHARVMDDHLEKMTGILSDIFLNSTFSPQEVDNERQVILSEIGMAEDNPEEHIHTLLEKSIWGNHPLGRSILGPRENVANFSAAAIKNFFSNFYQPDKIVISAAGNIDHQRLVDLMGPSFETIGSDAITPLRQPPVRLSEITFVSRELEQVHACIGTQGVSITSPERFPVSLFNTILGGNMSSRLFQKIREKNGLAYSIYSFSSASVDSGMVGIYVGTAPESLHTSLDLIFKEIKKLKQKNVTDSELRDAKEYTKGNLLLSSESTDNQMVRLAQNEIHFGRELSLSGIIKEIESVTLEDIHTLTHKVFDSSKKPAVALLGPVTDFASLQGMFAF